MENHAAKGLDGGRAQQIDARLVGAKGLALHGARGGMFDQTADFLVEGFAAFLGGGFVVRVPPPTNGIEPEAGMNRCPGDGTALDIAHGRNSQWLDGKIAKQAGLGLPRLMEDRR